MGATFTITQQPSSVNLYLYPEADSATNLTPVGAANNYDCVNDNYSLPDTNTYVYTTNIAETSDLYTLQNHGKSPTMAPS